MTAPDPIERRRFIARTVATLGAGSWLAALEGRAAAAPQQESPFIAEIRMFAGTFAPDGWAFCDGQLLPISQYDALFALIGTTYGGDGQSTFALPDLRGRAPVHQGTTWVLGQSTGSEQVTLTTGQLPSHAHAEAASTSPGDSDSPVGRVPARNAAGSPVYGSNVDATLAAGALQAAGGSGPHANMQPYLAINFIISLFGVFPSQS
jgi:microcystin-dependent protein